MNIQRDLKAPKDKKNEFGGYYYRSAESILEAVKPLAAANGCALLLNDELLQLGDRYYIKATAILRNGESSISATAYAREEDSKKGLDASQLTGAVSSYARKYALNALFCIDDTKDADALNNNAEFAGGTPKKTRSSKKSADEAITVGTYQSELDACTTDEEVVEIWGKYSELHADSDFRNAVALARQRIVK